MTIPPAILNMLLAVSILSVRHLPLCTYRNNGAVVYWEQKARYCRCDATIGEWVSYERR